MIYLIVLIIILIGIGFDLKGIPCDNKKYIRLYYLTYLLLALVPGLSYRIGIDTPTYMREFLEYPKIGSMSISRIIETTTREPLWVLFNSFCKMIIDDFAFMHTIHALLFNFVIFYFVNKHTKKRFVAITFYFFGFWVHTNFGALREGLAMIFFFIATDLYLRGHNIWKCFIIALPAIFFHKFAFIPIFLFPFADLLHKHKLVAVLCLVFVYVGFNYFIDNILLFVWESSQDFYEIMDAREEELTYNVFGMLKNLIIRAIPPFLVAYLGKNTWGKQFDRYTTMLYMCVYVGILSSAIPLLMRVYFYFMMIMAVTVGNLVDEKRLFVKKNDLMGICLAVSFMWFVISGVQHIVEPTATEYRSNVNYNAAYFPYSSVFTMEEDPIREGLPRR